MVYQPGYNPRFRGCIACHCNLLAIPNLIISMKIRLNKNRHRSALTLVGVIMGCMLIVVGVIFVVLLKRASNIKPKELPPEETSQYYQPFNPVLDLSPYEMPYQLWDVMQREGTNWPKVNDVYVQGSSWMDVPPQPAYEIVGLDNFDVLMCVNCSIASQGTVASVSSLIGNTVPQGSTNEVWFNVGRFANGDTNTIYTNAFITMQMKPDLSGVDIQQTEWAKTNVQTMFFKSVKVQ